MDERTDAMLKIVLAFSKARENCEVGLCVNASYLNCGQKRNIIFQLSVHTPRLFFFLFRARIYGSYRSMSGGNHEHVFIKDPFLSLVSIFKFFLMSLKGLLQREQQPSRHDTIPRLVQKKYFFPITYHMKPILIWASSTGKRRSRSSSWPK